MNDDKKILDQSRYLYLTPDLNPLTASQCDQIKHIVSDLNYEKVIDGDAGDKHELLVGRLRNDLDLPEDSVDDMKQIDAIINSQQMQDFYQKITGFDHVCIRRCQINIMQDGGFIGIHSAMYGDPAAPESHLDYQYVVVVPIDSQQQQGGETVLYLEDNKKRINLMLNDMLVMHGDVLYGVMPVSQGCQKTLVCFLSDNFGRRREKCRCQRNLPAFRQHLLHQPMSFSAAELPISQEQWSALKDISDHVNYEEVAISNVGDSHNALVSRVIYDQTDGYVPKVMNTKIISDVLDILLSADMMAFYKSVLGDAEYMIPRCQFTILSKGGYISQHIDSDTNPHYYASIILYLCDDYTGGEYVYMDYLDKQAITVKTEKYTMVLSLSSRFPHYIDVVECGKLRTLTYFLALPMVKLIKSPR